MTNFSIRDPQRLPTHPGATLRDDVLTALRIGVTDAARNLGKFCGDGCVVVF